MADPALKRFAENGDSLLYDSQPQGYYGVFDTFYAEPIRGGQGRTSTFIMADGLHSKVGSKGVGGAGIACRLEPRTRYRKVAISNPGKSGGRIFPLESSLLC